MRARYLCIQQRSAYSSLPLLWPCGVLRDRALRKQALRAHGAWQREQRVWAATDVGTASPRVDWPAAYARRASAANRVALRRVVPRRSAPRPRRLQIILSARLRREALTRWAPPKATPRRNRSTSTRRRRRAASGHRPPPHNPRATQEFFSAKLVVGGDDKPETLLPISYWKEASEDEEATATFAYYCAVGRRVFFPWRHR